ncbi:MAG: tRNA pseudouridine(38-40) synthase TruA [Syntrophomonadaceae bacterium]|nr:tRNA pseudouridine(38-40) synthase TruA [Syntrophomonadaceae bacterium]
MRIKLLVEYDGSDFHGFQRQTGLRTVDRSLEEAICLLTGEEIRVKASGRTDAGVHALGQVVAFDTTSGIPPDRFAWALNTKLPADIRVLSSEKVHPDFHPRYDARSKTYRYLIYRSPEGYTLQRRYTYGYCRPLDLPVMELAAKELLGEHDFRGWMASGSNIKDTVRTIYTFSIEEHWPYLIFEVAANGFLYHMVRNLVGTLLEIGREAMPLQSITTILQTGDRNQAGPTAPATGLYLVKVEY